ncbi:10421_t:CDS:1, partial [Funneliformis mosseae]
ISIFFAAAIVVIPHLYLTKGKFISAARALRIPRIEFVLSAIWAVLILIATFLLTIDAALLRKCDPFDQKHAEYNRGPNNETFIKGLPNICRTQRAANAFGWLALTAWLCSLVLIANDWRKNRRQPATQGPTIFPDNRPSNTSSSTLEHNLSDTTTQPTQEN